MKKTYFNAPIITIGLILNIILNILLIPILNIYGAAISTVFSSIILVFLFYRYSQKFYFINYEIKKIAQMFVLGISIFLITLLINDIDLIFRIPVKLVLIASFPFILYLINFYETVELQRISEAWDKWKNPLNWKKNLLKIKL